MQLVRCVAAVGKLAIPLAALVAFLSCAGSLLSADKPDSADYKSGSHASGRKLDSEIDISGPYHAHIDGKVLPSTVDIWGPKATLQVSIDGQDRPMIGMFLKNRMQVMAKYGAENFNLTTAVQADYDGRNFKGEYRRIDEKLGPKATSILLTPVWHGGAGGAYLKMPLPRKPSDVPGKYAMELSKDGKAVINTRVQFEVDEGEVKLQAGGREYVADFSDKELAPVYWHGNRMDVFKLEPTESGFKGTFVREVSGKQETFDVTMSKVKEGTGGGGHEREYTYVYDVIIANAPPVLIGKLALHEDKARLVIDTGKEKAAMQGSLVDDVLSATGHEGRLGISIRAKRTPNGFAGAFRRGVEAAAAEVPIVLKNRPQPAAPAGPSW